MPIGALFNLCYHMKNISLYSSYPPKEKQKNIINKQKVHNKEYIEKVSTKGGSQKSERSHFLNVSEKMAARTRAKLAKLF